MTGQEVMCHGQGHGHLKGVHLGKLACTRRSCAPPWHCMRLCCRSCTARVRPALSAQASVGQVERQRGGAGGDHAALGVHSGGRRRGHVGLQAHRAVACRTSVAILSACSPRRHNPTVPNDSSIAFVQPALLPGTRIPLGFFLTTALLPEQIITFWRESHPSTI